MTKRVGLLLVGHIDAQSTHVAGDYPELFATLLEAHDVDLVTFDVDHDETPMSVDECDGWVVSGSRSSVYDDEPWIPVAEDLVRAIVDADRPLVGVCFGHQLLAQALGAGVARADDGWQVGVHEYELVDQPAWMDPAPGRVRLLASHQDQVRALPDGARLLARATSGPCPIAGFTVGERIWTIQPHPEFVAPLSDHLLAGRVELIGADRVAAARAGLGTPLDRGVVAAWIARTVGAG